MAPAASRRVTCVTGIEYLHNHGISHRDLKPENLVLDANFQLKIVDFGFAASFAEAGGGVLHTGVGSQPYSAPEVFYGKDLFDGRGYRGPPADIWSATVILFVMLTGRPPFARPLTQTVGEHRRCKHFVNLLRGSGYGDCPSEARAFLTKLFQPDPALRPTLTDIKKDEWFNGPVPSPDSLSVVMQEKAHSVWLSQQKMQMVEIMAKIQRGLPQTPHLTAVELPYDPFAGTNFDLSSMEPRADGIATPARLTFNEDCASPSPGSSPPVVRFTFEGRPDAERPVARPQARLDTETAEESGNKRADRREDRPHGVPLLSKRFTRLVAGIPVPEILNALTSQLSAMGVSFYVDAPTRKLYVTGDYQSSEICCLVRVLSTGSSGNSIGQKVFEFEKIRGDTSSFLVLFNQATSVLVAHGASPSDDVS